MIYLIIKIAICAAFALATYKLKILDFWGTSFATFIGAIIIFLKGIGWFTLLLIFLIAGAFATNYKLNFKKRRLQEKASRKAINVIANGSVPTIIAILSINYNFSMIYASAIGVALADTLASELGVLSDNAYLITNFKKIEPGTNGAISLYGEMWAFTGSLIISLSAYFLLNLDLIQVVIVILISMFGCQIDSLLGATFQGKGKGSMMASDTILTNSDVNLVSISLATLTAYIIEAII